LGGPEIAAWIVISLALTSLPLYAVFRVLLRDWRNQRAAEALGARLVPVKKGKSIGSIDILRQMRHNRKHGYPGTNSTHHSVCAYVRKSERTDLIADGLNQGVEELGPVVNFKVLWMDTILTTSPEHVKLILSTDFNNYVKGMYIMSVFSASLTVRRRPFQIWHAQRSRGR
jgi:hypothetical protein